MDLKVVMVIRGSENPLCPLRVAIYETFFLPIIGPHGSFVSVCTQLVGNKFSKPNKLLYKTFQTNNFIYKSNRL